MNQKITFPELIELMAHKQKCSKREAENFLRELMTLMTDTVSSGESLRVNSLGTFKPVWVEERVSVNVQTGEPYTIPGHYKLTFTPVKAVREAINEPFSCFVVEVLPDDAPCIDVPQISDEMAENALESVVEECETPNEQPADVSVVLPVVDVADEVTPIVEEIPEVVEAEIPTVEEPEQIPEQEQLPEDEQSSESELVPEHECEAQPESDTAPEQVQEFAPDQQPENIPTPDAEEDSEADAEKFDESVKKAYRKGLWIGIAVAFVLFALLALAGYFYQTRYAVSSEVPTVHHSLVTDTLVDVAPQDTVVVVDTVAVAEAPVDSAVAVVDIVPVVVTDTVKRGVFLTNVSLRHYGHKAFWVYIYEENKEIIPNPDNVAAGTVVAIPPAEKYGIDAADTVAVNKALKIADEIKQKRLK